MCNCQDGEYLQRDPENDPYCLPCDEKYEGSLTCNVNSPLTCVDGRFVWYTKCLFCKDYEMFSGSETCISDKALSCKDTHRLVDGLCECNVKSNYLSGADN